MNTIRFNVDPVAKPRMTRRDVWKKRPVVERYKDWRTAVQLLAKSKKYTIGGVLEATFFVRMPDSWPEKKKLEMMGQPHQQRPDLDNFVKAWQDALCKDDSHVWCYKSIKKVWAREGSILVYI